MKHLIMLLINHINKLPYWYASLEESEQRSISAISFILGFVLVVGAAMPAHASETACPVVTHMDLTEEQRITLDVCAELAFRESMLRYEKDGMLVVHAYNTYRIGWCLYHELYPDNSVEQYHEWLACRNEANGMDYFF